ncbi:hypothetical protein AnigIFM56816_004197 [Aspergillus niger]|uniref:SMP domain-containing protein n=1 Tax=Aspergillus welwitschiae TaxID=1341132 RepID=A0A3F3Q6E7_9EURO|nr:hypothetical protein BDQ94DRAFT_169015 [Aspergillus welwitschiae]KAI2847933.1 hypothetical protein CBS11350_2874 [Aspergillus niger]KAI2859043.1 hypothetical protein CBS12448_5921 [Aspergillus niger]KAI2916986.1 hypothetical protein CBS147371_4936 [Aspergillus niger]KAI2974547.1 hypothetical protein CBS147324_3507 [Aspergillus niger]KAI2988503.1 hypothetical protein CBS147344_3835 [Aspergillus niger]
MPSNQTTKSDASRIQSSQARGGKDMSSGGFAARAQAAADRNANVASSKTGSSHGPSSGTQQSGQQSTPGKR